MKIWLLSDTHIGFKNGSREWFAIFNDFLENYLYPLFVENVGKDDVLIHCGDVFDDRQSINLTAMNIAIGMFEKLGKMFAHTYVICGNHDVQNNNSNDIASIDCLKYIPNISIYKTQTVVKVGGKTINLVPWENDNTKLLSQMVDNPCDYTFCHAEMIGATWNASGMLSKNGVDLKELKNIKNIYSGHIHHRHKIKNTTYVGSPYSMSMNDAGNEKGVYSIDLDTGGVVFHPNDISPKFEKINYEELKGKTEEEITKYLKNKFVDIVVDSKEVGNKPLQKFLNGTTAKSTARNINIKVTGEEQNPINIEMPKISETMSLEEMMDSYINDILVCDDKTRELVRIVSKRLLHG